MKLSELKSIIRECIEELNESGPADRHRRKTGYHYKDVTKTGKGPNRMIFMKKTKPNNGGKAGGYNVLHKSRELGEEKKYHTSPPAKGFNRAELMAVKKKSINGKIIGAGRKINKLKNGSGK